MVGVINDDFTNIEYFCNDCDRRLYPQNAVTYVYYVEDLDGDYNYFLCREHAQPFLDDIEETNKHCTIIRYRREMHLKFMNDDLPRIREMHKDI